MSEYASIDDLTEGDDVGQVTRDVPLPNGKVVKVRGLSRYELLLNGKNTEDTALIERRNIATCMVEPRMTLAQVEVWQKKASAGGAFGALSTAIRDLSGLGEGADKSDVQELRNES
jgi:hypothetical protein